MKYIEVELKFPLKNKEKLIKQLKEVGEDAGKVNQVDTYFIPIHRNFLKRDPIKEWLRIREVGEKNNFNYKNFHHDKEYDAISCDEFETSIEDSEVMRKILKALNFKEIIKVDKIRNAWMYKEIEVAIDEVKGLGDYLEMELKGDFEVIDEAKEKLYSVLKELNADVGKQIHKGYPHLLLEKNEKSNKNLY